MHDLDERRIQKEAVRKCIYEDWKGLQISRRYRKLEHRYKKQ